ncbi:MAG: DMT family transporter [Phycisphaerales bacterium]|nr:DMT family transporter [Phycisphaerales bacterium]
MTQAPSDFEITGAPPIAESNQPTVATKNASHAAEFTPRLRHYIIATLVPISWSFSFVAGKYVMTVTPTGPFTVSMFRFVTALAALTPMVFFIKRLRKVPPRDYAWMFLLGFLCVTLYHYLFFRGLALAPAGISSIVLATLPIMINICAGLFLGERVTINTFVGGLIAAAGITTIALEKGNWTLAGWGRGETFILCGAFAWLLYTLLGRDLYRKYNPVMASIYVFAFGVIACLPGALSEETFYQLAEQSWAWWGCISYMGVAATAFGVVAFNTSIRILGAGKTAMFLLIVPPTTNIWGYLLFNEPATWIKSICIVVVLFGVWLAIKRPRTRAV